MDLHRALALCSALAGSLAGAALAAAPPQEPPPITLKDVYDVPPSRSPRGHQWSPDGTRLAWLQSGEDRKTRLHIRTLAGGATVTVPGDLSITRVVWAPSGRALAAVAEGDLYIVELPAAGEPVVPRRLTRTDEEESDPKFSPDGRSIGFVRHADLHVVDPASGTERPLTEGGVDDEVLNGAIDWVYEEELDISSGWWWSPDSRRVAYLQLDERDVPRFPLVDWMPVHPEIRWQRYPKAGDPNPVPRVGVLDVPAATAATPGAGAASPRTPKTRWLDLGAGQDIYVPRVAWTPDGRVAVQRLDRARSSWI
jgi:dipeptidyl-peptidase-4